MGRTHIWAEAPLLHDARPEVLYQDVRPVGEAPQDVPPLLPVQVQGDAAPVAALQGSARMLRSSHSVYLLTCGLVPDLEALWKGAGVCMMTSMCVLHARAASQHDFAR